MIGLSLLAARCTAGDADQQLQALKVQDLQAARQAYLLSVEAKPQPDMQKEDWEVRDVACRPADLLCSALSADLT